MSVSDSPQPAPRSRDISFDAFRGIAILLVVIAHCGAIGWGFSDAVDGRWNYYYSIFLRQTILCALPIFVFVSGYWLASTRCASFQEYRTFLSKRLTRILIPYLFWSVFFYALFALRGQPHSISDFAFRLLTGQVEAAYFFLLMLIQFYLLTPFFIRLSNVPGSFAIVALAHALFVALLYALRLWVDKDISFAYIKMPFLSWMAFFYLGVILRRKPDALEAVKAPWLFCAAVFFLGLSILEGGMLIASGSFEFGISDIKNTTLLYAAAVLLFFFKIRGRIHWPQFLAIIGNYAFGIYFIHGFFLRGFHKAFMTRLPALYQIQPLYQIAVFCATLAVSCGIIYATRRVIGASRAEKWLGF